MSLFWRKFDPETFEPGDRFVAFVLQSLEKYYKGCTICGGLFKKEKLSSVIAYGVSGMTMQNSPQTAYIPFTQTAWYCKACKPPYDSMATSYDGKTTYSKKVAERWVSVDKAGKEIA